MTTTVIVRWVRGQASDDGVRRMLEHADDQRPLREIEDPQSWSSYRQATALLEAAVAVTGRPDAARRIGEEMLTQHCGTPVLELLQSLGSPEALLESIAASGSKFSTVLFLQPLEVAPGRATVAGTTARGIPRHRLLCDFTAGILSVVPNVFGMHAAIVAESECQARGGRQCTYHLTWNPASSPEVADTTERIHYLEEELAGVRSRLVSLQNTAAEMVAASDVSSALAAVARRAGQAVGATAYLLGVRLRPRDEPLLHGAGLSNDEAARLREVLLGDQLAVDVPAEDRIIVDVRSGERLYGRLAACYPQGAKFFPEERDLLVAYAGHAAAVLDTAAAIEEARAQNRTSRALLDLSAALARVGSREEVAQRLVSAVPELVDCDRASVLLWEETSQRLLLAASYGDASPLREHLRVNGISPESTPALAGLLADPAPLFLTSDAEDPFLAELVNRTGASAIAVLPIVGHERFYGVVTAEVTGSPDRLRPDPDLLERIAGIAYHGATALESAKLLEELRAQARHDALTGQPNRTLLIDRLEHALAAAPRDHAAVALMFLDLDRFKEVNDVFGHVAGDGLLVQVAARLAATVRDGDTVARLGGDEFAVLLPKVHDEREAVGCAQRIIAAMEPPFVLDETEFYMSASIGISTSYGHDTHALALLREADQAMYAAKSHGGGVFELASPLDPTASRRRLLLESALRTALPRNELTVLFQPVVDVASTAVVGVEALVRWQHPDLRVLNPAEFLDVAEEIGLIVDIDLWVLRESCRQLRVWLATGHAPVRMAVNVSGRTVRSGRLAAAVAHELADGALVGLLELEISERVLDAELLSGTAELQSLTELGAMLAVDDFGTGNSSFARLQHDLVGTLKIDSSFLREIRRADTSAPLLEALIRMAHGLGLRLVAEGVERKTQSAWLLRHGCPLAQGFLYSRPVEAARVETSLRPRVVSVPEQAVAH